MSVHYVLLFEIYQKPLSFRPYVEFTKGHLYNLLKKKSQETGLESV